MSNTRKPRDPSHPSNPNSPDNINADTVHPDNISVNEPAQPAPQTPAQMEAAAEGPTLGQQTGSQTNASQASLRPIEEQEPPDSDKVMEGSEMSFPASDPPAY